MLNGDDMLSAPVTMDTGAGEGTKLERPKLPPGEVAEGFKPFTFRVPVIIDPKKTVMQIETERLTKSDFKRQYSQVYSTRLFDAYLNLEQKVTKNDHYDN